MSTSQPVSSPSTPRQRGKMYLRAEQRHREELAETRLASVLPAASEPGYQPRVEAPADAITMIAGTPPVRLDSGSSVMVAAVDPVPVVTPVAPPVPTRLSPAEVPSAVETPTLPLPVPGTAWTSSPRARSTRRRTTLIPAAALGGIAVALMLGVTLMLTAGGERQEVASVGAAAPPPSTLASAAPVSSAVAPALPQPTTPSRSTSDSVSGPAAAARAVTQPAAAAARPAPPVARTARTVAVAATTVPSGPRAIEGQLRVTSTPAGARVTIDGIGWGQTPITVGHLTFGSRTVRVTHDGYTAHQTVVTLSSGAPNQAVNLTLRKR